MHRPLGLGLRGGLRCAGEKPLLLSPSASPEGEGLGPAGSWPVHDLSLSQKDLGSWTHQGNHQQNPGQQPPRVACGGTVSGFLA